MGKAKPVTIAGLHFLKQGEALEYFMSKRPELINQSQIIQGELFDALKDLYIRYCENSPGWELNGRLITAFLVDFEPRKNNGGWASYPCYKVHFSNNETRPFSIKKALQSL